MKQRVLLTGGITLLILLSGVLLLSSEINEEVIEEKGPKLFSAGDYTLNYPSSWNYSVNNQSFTFTSPNKTANVVVKRINDALFEGYSEVVDDYALSNIVSEESTTLGGEDGEKKVTKEDGTTKEVISAFHEDYYYLIMCTAPGNAFSNYTEEFELIKSSFAYYPSKGLSSEDYFCDAVKECPEGFSCYQFEDESSPICWNLNPCSKCDSGNCSIAESYPMQVFCE